jgi:4-hydroxy-4-methyl-2-oxoglutarate aldolase
MEPLTAEELERLRSYDTPTIANAIETFNIQPRTAGFITPEIKCIYPNLGVMIGYAITARVRASVANTASYSRHAWWDALAAAQTPSVVVIEDIDQPPVGAFWGEIQANIHGALGCVGTVTNGGVRDLREVEALGFQYYAGSVMVSHAYIEMLDFGKPVNVGGLTVSPGNLIHADLHGVQVIPLQIAREIPAVCEKLAAKERTIFALCQSPDFTLDKLKAIQQ